MESKVEIARNKAALDFKIKLFTVSYIILGILGIIILTVPFRLGDSSFIIGTLLIIVLALIGLWGSLAYMKKKWYSTHYYITENSIIISTGVKSRQDDICRFESVVSASVRQSYFGKQKGYGDIILNAPHVEHGLALRDIERPADLIGRLHEKLATSTTNPNAL